MLENHIAADVADRATTRGPELSSLLQIFLEGKQFTTSHPRSVENATSVVAQIRTQVRVAELWLSIARWFSAMAGVPTRDIETAIELRQTSTDPNDSTIVLAMEMEEQALSERCFQMAAELIDTSVATGFPLATKVRELFDFADDVRLGPSSRAILRAARRRNIPYLRLNSGSLVQLGEGKHQRRIWTAETDATSAIAEAIASDKDLTKRLLRQVGVPVPHGRAVASAEDAWLAAQEIGFPVVVKPCNANHQRGISIELSLREEILKAYDWAVQDGETTNILVEQYARGYHHRLLVVGNRLVAAAKGHSECIVGDGVQSVESLVAELNRDPRRGEAYTDPLGVIKLDAAAIIELEKQGYSIESVPNPGVSIVVRRTGDLTTDCTEDVHPDTAEQAVLAARVVGLDIAGLDILATDIRLPLEPQRGAVVEVNAGPSLSPHVTPLYGKPQKVGDAIMEMLFPSHQVSHIRIIGVVKSQGSEVLLQQFSEQLRLRNIDFGIVSHGQAGFNGRIVDTGSASDEERVTALLCNPLLNAIVVHLDLQRIALVGVGAPRLDRLMFPPNALPAKLDGVTTAGLRAVLHAVPSSGTIVHGPLPATIVQLIADWKQPDTKLRNSLDRAFDVAIA